MSICEKVKKLFKKAVMAAGIIYFFNTAITPLSYCIDLPGFQTRAVMSKEVACAGGFGIDFDYYKGKGITSKDSSVEQKALGWLKYANTLTTLYLIYDTSNHVLDWDKILSSRRGDCSHYSEMTYSKFLEISKRLGMDEMNDYVRSTGGYCKGGAHHWLEIKLNGEWVPFEATAFEVSGVGTQEFLDEFNLSPIEFTVKFLKDEYVLGEKKNYQRELSIQINKDGQVVRDIAWKNSLLHFKGTIGNLIEYTF
jgi:hypothetical protein